MSSNLNIYWFRQDLRLDDNPALLAACQRGPVIPVFIWAPDEERDWAPGAASRWWLGRSLASLDSELGKFGSRLLIRRGPSQAALSQLAVDTGATKVFWNRRYEPAIVRRDAEVQSILRSQGIATEISNASLLFDPSEILNQQGRPYQVFTAFWNRCVRLPEPSRSLPTPVTIGPPSNWPAGLSLTALSLDPRSQFSRNLDTNWCPGAPAAAARLGRFADNMLLSYPQGRDRPDIDETSRLSPHLHFGEISPRRLWHTVREHARQMAGRNCKRSYPAAKAYLRQIIWREFAYYILHHFPRSADHPSRPEFAAFPWRKDPEALEAWEKGLTGYPLVDAGMRQLQATGWMHNRVRMIVASFLVKHLMLHWQTGARWFWEKLVDADLANNAFGWQWSAGCGYDAAPYFRIFNPVLQGQRFDSQGDYIRRWVPELCGLEPKWIHQPWNAPASKLAAAHVRLGKDYPARIVEHSASRERALAALNSIREIAVAR